MFYNFQKLFRGNGGENMMIIVSPLFLTIGGFYEGVEVEI